MLQSISSEWYEAAEVDGATRWQKFRHITLPHVLFATAPLLIIQYTTNFNNFNIIYLFNEGGPAVQGQNAGGTDILISWVYKLTFETNDYSMAAAISLIIGLIVSIFAIFQFRRTSSFKEEGEHVMNPKVKSKLEVAGIYTIFGLMAVIIIYPPLVCIWDVSESRK